MQTHTFTIYAPEVISYDPDTNAVTLAPDFDPATGRRLVEVTDDDVHFDGDADADEVGEDANQTGAVTRPDGSAVASGPIYGEEFWVLRAPDGSTLWLDRIEIAGELMGYWPSVPLVPGESYTLLRIDDIDDAVGGNPNNDTRLTHAEYAAGGPVCFAPETVIATDRGGIRVDALMAGDRVITVEGRAEPVVWAGVSDPVRLTPDHWPIRVAPGALGEGAPLLPVRLSPQHRVLVRHPLTALHFGSGEVFVPARALCALPGVRPVRPARGFRYYHVALARHAILPVAGLEAETLLCSATSLGHLAPGLCAHLTAALSASGLHPGPCRPCLSVAEAHLLLRLIAATPHEARAA